MTTPSQAELRRRIAEISRLEWLEHFSGVLAVVESVGGEYRPKKINWGRLKQDIDSAIWWIDSRYLDAHKKDRAAENAYQALENAAKQVADLHDEYRLKALDLIEFARNKREYEARVRVNWPALNRPFSTTIGSLSRVFEIHFGRKASAGGSNNGPFVRFCLAVLNDYRDDPKKKPIAAATVVRALRTFESLQREIEEKSRVRD
jgi:hypothetical protein